MPSGEKTTVTTPRSCSSRVAFSFLVARSQSVTVPPASIGPSATARVLPSGEYATDLTGVRVPLEGRSCGLPACGQAPELHGPVLAGRGEQTSVGREDDLIDLVVMALEQAELPAAPGVPENHVAAFMCRRKNATVG